MIDENAAVFLERGKEFQQSPSCRIPALRTRASMESPRVRHTRPHTPRHESRLPPRSRDGAHSLVDAQQPARPSVPHLPRTHARNFVNEILTLPSRVRWSIQLGCVCTLLRVCLCGCCPPLQDWPDNWQLRGTPCGPSSRACKPHLMTPAASQACRYWGLMSMCGITRTDAAGARVSLPASWT